MHGEVPYRDFVLLHAPGVVLLLTPFALIGRLTSDPTGFAPALIAMNVLGRNLRRGCRPVVDMAAYSYVLPRARGNPFPRRRDAAWQRFALSHLTAADAVILTNYRRGMGLSEATAEEVCSWPVIREAGRYTVRAPVRSR